MRDAEAFLTGKPGNKPVDPAELEGDRFTALGQFGVDVEYFVASPASTPRYTLRCGEAAEVVGLLGGVWQDLLHLQMPADGAYLVALFPRRRTEPAPSFSALGTGAIIKVSGDFGTDYGFLCGADAEDGAEDVSFRGTAASVQDRKSGLVLSLGAKGEVRYRQYALVGEQAASLSVTGESLIIELPAKHPGATLTMAAPSAWKVADAQKGVRLLRKGATEYTLVIPTSVTLVRMVKG